MFYRLQLVLSALVLVVACISDANAASRLDTEMALLERKAAACDASIIERGSSSMACREFERYREHIFPDGASAYAERNLSPRLSEASLSQFQRAMKRSVDTMRHLVADAAR